MKVWLRYGRKGRETLDLYVFFSGTTVECTCAEDVGFVWGNGRRLISADDPSGRMDLLCVLVIHLMLFHRTEMLCSGALADMKQK